MLAEVRSVGCLLVTTLLAAGAAYVLAANPPATSEGTGGFKEKRLALVIGNGAYVSAPLRNPVNDATDIAAALADSGFEVTRLENANLRELRVALRDFGDRLKKQGGVGLFYFAGHGMQVKGRNYLIPVGAQIEREDEVEFESLDANLVMEKLDSAGNRFNIVILDACRNNPFARAFRSSTQGLAQMDAPAGAVIAFATAPGSVASDGAGRNGLYTQHLVATVQRAGLKIEEVFKEVRAAVRRDSAGKQTPWEATSLEGDFYFHPVDLAVAEATRRQQEQARLEDAVRVAIAQERERARKEFEEARLQAATGIIAQTSPSTTPESKPGSAAGAPTVIAKSDAASITAAPPPTTIQAAIATAPPTVTPSGTLVSTPVALSPLGAMSTGGGEVIGIPVKGMLAAPKIEVDDEWELLSVTTNSALQPSQPAPVFVRVRVEDILGVTGGRAFFISSYTTDKPGGKANSPLTFYKIGYDATDFYFRAFNVDSQQKLQFPIEPGSTWSYSDTFRARDGYTGRDDLEYRALAWEQVSIPAGTFWALKIEVSGWHYNLSTLLAGQKLPQRIEGAVWYSPEVKYIVKSTYRVGLLTVTSTQLLRSGSAAASLGTKTVVN